MSEILERVAEAIIANLPPEGQHMDYTATARAAIAAMREPTDAMISYGAGALGDHMDNEDCKTAEYIWRTMIDEALK